MVFFTANICRSPGLATISASLADIWKTGKEWESLQKLLQTDIEGNWVPPEVLSVRSFLDGRVERLAAAPGYHGVSMRDSPSSRPTFSRMAELDFDIRFVPRSEPTP